MKEETFQQKYEMKYDGTNGTIKKEKEIARLEINYEKALADYEELRQKADEANDARDQAEARLEWAQELLDCEMKTRPILVDRT